jgi:hypothetical protein
MGRAAMGGITHAEISARGGRSRSAVKMEAARNNLEKAKAARALSRTSHHYVAERFFGRSKNRRGQIREAIFPECPWDYEKRTVVLCYECHEELIHNPVFLFH